MHLPLFGLCSKDGGDFSYHHNVAICGSLRGNGSMRDIELRPWWWRIGCTLLVLRGAESQMLLAETAAEMGKALPSGSNAPPLTTRRR